MPHVVCLTIYPVEGPCSRHRVWQFLPHLNHLGWQTTALPAVSSSYYRRYYQQSTSPAKVLRLMMFQARRVRHIVRASKADVVLVQREAATFGPPLYERWLAWGAKKPLVFDFDDNITRVSPKYGKAGALVQLVKCPGKTQQLISWSQGVIAGNKHLEELAREYNPNVTLIPTVVDHEKLKPRETPRAEGPLVLGWIGSHSTAKYLEEIAPVLQQTAQQHPILVRAIGAGRPLNMPGVPLDEREWDLKNEIPDLQGFDIGLYPLPNDTWTLGKSGFKAIQYMAAGIPAVCSPVGATQDIVQHGQTGFLPASNQEWIDVLDGLARDASLRERIGRAGRTRVEEWYCAEQQAPRLATALQQAIDTSRN